jgi:3-oxoadipate enol-lactonase
MRPLLFLHGVGGGKAIWDRQMEHFRGLGYRCLAWDQSGYGQSPMVEPYDFQAIAGTDFARAFVDARIKPLDAGKTMHEIAQDVMPAQRGRISDAEGLALAVRTMAAIPQQTYRKAVHLVTTFDRRADLEKIAVPALLVAGSDDLTAPPQMMGHMAQKIPGAEFVVLRGCGHLGPMDQPAEFNKVLEGFLKRRL